MAFGTNLKSSRTAKKVSQEQQAKALGLHANHISWYETGKATPSIEVAAKMTKALEVSLDEFLYGSQSNPEEALSDRELFALFKKV